MRFTFPSLLCLTAAGFGAASSASRSSWPTYTTSYGSSRPGASAPDEYTKLGCPTNTTKPYASFPEQIKALNDFSNLLLVQKKFGEAAGKYYASDIINHAAEVTQNGSAAAVASLAQLLPAANVQIQREYFGYSNDSVAYGTIHFKAVIPGEPAADIATVLRAIGTCFVEIWDIQGVVGNSSNPVAYF